LTLVAHELVTNAVQHARTDFVVRVDVCADAVRVEVHDDNPRRPILNTPPPFATSGRGLALVTSLADEWGVDADDDSKVVWARLHRRELEGDRPSSRSRLSGHWRPSDGLRPPADGLSLSA
jgi:anti-sigma regulatory factor (Ser/Thr protein kinase)